MLTTIPAELLNKILSSLTNDELYQLLTTCKYLYQKSLPQLYRHLKLRNHVYTRQLQSAIDNNPSLKDMILENTTHLTLRSAQEGNNWRTSDLVRIISKASKITRLTFINYPALSTTTIEQLIFILPDLKHIEIKYCHLVYRPLLQPQLKYNNATTTTPSTEQRNNIQLTHLSLEWTEFTEKSIPYSLYPHITHLDLGSNRNSYFSNECMAKSIMQHCPNTTRLTIALPQVTEPILCDLVTHYGKQLTHLSMRCDSARLLLAIAAHSTSHLTHLTLRITPSASSSEISDGILRVIQSCTKLSTLEIASCHLENDIPCVIWESIGTYYEKKANPNTKAIQVPDEMYASQRSVWVPG